MASLQSNASTSDGPRRVSVDTARLHIKISPGQSSAYMTVAVDEDTGLVIGHRIDPEPPAWFIVMEWLRTEICSRQ
jgi:hypothetical protein